MAGEFYYQGHRYNCKKSEWSEKQGVPCVSTDCPLRNENGRCKQTIASHCCKHVVKGSVSEQEKYQEFLIKQRKGKNPFIPDRLYSTADDVILNYQDLSSEVLNNPASISLCGDRSAFRIACEGKDALNVNGFSVYMAPADSKSWSPKIISCYYNHSSPEDYVLHRLIKIRYIDRKMQAKGISSVPIYINQNTIAVPNADLVFQGAAELCRKNNPDEHSLSRVALYLYYYIKDEEELRTFYSSMENYIDLDISIENMIININDPALKEIRNEVKNKLVIYQSKNVTDYLLSVAQDSFDPVELSYYREKQDEYLSTIKFKPNEEQWERLDLLLNRIYLNLRNKNLKQHYMQLDNIIQEIESNQDKGESCEFVADYSAYFLVSDYIGTVVAAKTLWDKTIECFRSKPTRIMKVISEDILVTLGEYDRFVEATAASKLRKGSDFTKWRRWLEQLLQIDTVTAELRKNCSGR